MDEMNKEEYVGGAIPKCEVAEMYKISTTTLQKLLNRKYFDLLSPFGYEKNQKKLTPKQFRTFQETYGKP